MGRVTNLSRDTQEQDLLTLIQKASYRGSAFVECASPEDVAKCAETLNLVELKGLKIWCVLRAPRRTMQRHEKLAGKAKEVIVQDLNYKTQESQMRALCAAHGKVEDFAQQLKQYKVTDKDKKRLKDLFNESETGSFGDNWMKMSNEYIASVKDVKLHMLQAQGSE